ncbi:MAG: Uma2 family endonuclease [Candidatus Omnitrophota bacterium]|jgi:Uma2 family endonuclease|nr:MAG: Uma2 family endonuclease [Candidatus Omnitrophota bacterium]
MIVQPSRHWFKVDEYYELGRTGILKEEDRVELVEGEIIHMVPIGIGHAGNVAHLSDLFHRILGNQVFIWNQNPIRIDVHSEPQPDLALLKRAPGKYMNEHPNPNDIFLVVEVSDTTLYYDRHTKVPLYARSGISEVWIVNLIDKTVEVYWEPSAAGYAKSRVVEAGQTFSPRAFPAMVLQVGEEPWIVKEA